MIPASLKRIAPWLVLAAVLVLADQASKLAISSNLRFGEMREITPFFNLVLAHNRGAAFSFLSDAGGWQRVLFIVIAVAATAVIVVLLARHSSERLFSAGLTLILGGALGNLWIGSLSATWWIFSTFTPSAGISGPSISPMRRSQWGRGC